MRFTSLLRFTPAIPVVLAAACSSESTPNNASSTSVSASSTSTGGGGGGGGMGGAGGGAPMDISCVSSPKPAPFPGTDDCPAPSPAAADLFDAALTNGGTDRCHVRLTAADVALSGWGAKYIPDPRALPHFGALHIGPLRLPAYARETSGFLDAAMASKTPVSGVIVALSERRGHTIDSACADLSAFQPTADDATPLATAALLLIANQKGTADETAARAAANKVPRDLQVKLARVIGALDWAATETRTALGAVDAPTLKYLSQSFSLYAPRVFAWDITKTGIDKLDKPDIGRISAAAAVVAKVIEEADFAGSPAATFPAFELKTPLGPIVVHDSGDDLYAAKGSAEHAVLLFDLGGNDTYQVGAGASDDKHPISVAIDVRGNDHWGYKEVPNAKDTGILVSDASGRYQPQGTPDKDYGPVTLSRTARQGVGLAGIGLLFDLGKGKDVYRSLAISQGFASMGVGVLYDDGGDDDYAAEVCAQGAATFGIGALLDAGGNDTYASVTFSQGFGGAKGAGVLVDSSGDDTYLVDVGDPALGGHPLYLSAQLPGKGNTSMSQGVGMGRRPADGTDASYMAGGIGVLRDKEGSDHYTGSVFAQGAGYWQALGMLLDGGGADTYDGLWYVQGAAAHFSLAVLLDESGDDHYNPTFAPAATSIGVGHDFSAALHLDLGGNDTYRAPGLSLGSGNINGIGCFVNVGGDDQYMIAGDPTLGAGNYSSEAPFGLPRQSAPTIGIFVDAGGKDTYTVAGVLRPLDDTTWSYEPQPYPMPMMVTSEIGCSADGANGTVSLP